MPQGYDIIGDVQGEAQALEALLSELGYIEDEGVYRHRDGDRQAIFVGDYVDRGHGNARVLQIVRNMVESGNARAIMGNHELDHVRYATKGANGKYQLPHDGVRDTFLKTCLDEMPFGSEPHGEMVSWFKTLPVYIETENFTVAHANHAPGMIEALREHATEDGVLPETAYNGTKLSSAFGNALRNTLYGPSVGLPEGVKDSLIAHERAQKGEADFTSQRGIRRIYWWKDAQADPQDVLGLGHLDLSDEHRRQLQQVLERRASQPGQSASAQKPVFFGHYDLNADPHLTSDTAICLDFKGSVTAYRYNEGDGKSVFPDRLVSVRTSQAAPDADLALRDV
jgi:hypothetical protein